MMVMRRKKRSTETNTEEVDMVEGKWAYRRDPWSPVRIVSLNGNPEWPVVSIDALGELREHSRTGALRSYSFKGNGKRSLDLVHCLLWQGQK